VYGNALTLIGAFLLACQWHIDFKLFVGTLLGTSLVIASACTFNNYIDRGIDAKMVRTKKRALAAGHISKSAAMLYACLLAIAGFRILLVYVSDLVALIGLIAFVDYIVIYGYVKRHSPYGTLVGSVAGAAPPVAGYAAVTGHLDLGAGIIFLIMVCWQMVHFYAIAIRRSKDYKSAGIPVLPLVKGERNTKIEMIFYTLAFTLAVVDLSLRGYTGWTFAIVMGSTGLYWLYKGLRSFSVRDNVAWAKGMFLFSLVVVLLLSTMWSLGSILP